MRQAGLQSTTLSGLSLSTPMVRAVASAVGFCALAALGAHVRVPVPGTPVPMTLQLVAVLLAGLCLTPTLAASAMGLYVAVGIVGLPVFAPGSAGVLGVTGGYIVGFVFGAAALSWLRAESRSMMRRSFAAAVCVLIVFACGVLWQTALFGVGLADVIRFGLLPFLPKAAVELCLVLTAVRLMDAMRVRRGAAEVERGSCNDGV